VMCRWPERVTLEKR